MSEGEFVSAFPLPPKAFYEDKDENAIKLMTPPEIPSAIFTAFGLPVNTSIGLPDLETMRIRQLYDSESAKTGSGIKKELLRLYLELKIKIKEFLEKSNADPSSTTQIVLHYQNMHHLLNMLRSHQAIASLQNELNQ